MAVFQGCVLLAWLAVKCWLLRTVIWLHYFYASIGLMPIVRDRINESPSKLAHSG
jgi:hypothetical protein